MIASSRVLEFGSHVKERQNMVDHVENSHLQTLVQWLAEDRRRDLMDERIRKMEKETHDLKNSIQYLQEIERSLPSSVKVIKEVKAKLVFVRVPRQLEVAAMLGKNLRTTLACKISDMQEICKNQESMLAIFRIMNDKELNELAKLASVLSSES